MVATLALIWQILVMATRPATMSPAFSKIFQARLVASLPLAAMPAMRHRRSHAHRPLGLAAVATLSLAARALKVAQRRATSP